MRLFRVLLACVACLGPGALSAQATLDTALLAGDFTLEEIDTLIAENAEAPEVAFDLLSIKARRLAAQGAIIEAAETTLVMAALTERFPDDVAADLPSLYWDAGDLFLEAGALESARDAFRAALDTLADRAPGQDLFSALVTQLAEVERALGNDDRAAQFRAMPLGDTYGAAPGPARSSDDGFVTIDVHYATDRARSGNPRPSRFYGAERATWLEFGIARVTVPESHVPGAIDAPSIFRLEFAANPTKHIILQSVTPTDADAFFASMRSGLAERGANDVFVFVHGYNVAFDDAAKRTAQLAYDMDFSGLPVLYSWPSQGSTAGYLADTAVVRLSGRRLTLFLEDLAARSGASTIHLIAHSMGNRAATDALELMALRGAPVEAPVFDQIIFAAPDVDQGLFASMLPTIRPLARRLTLYASNEDWALAASRKLHGDAPRAGQGGDALIEIAGLDAIDMTGLGEDMLAHSYVANDPSALLDIAMLFWRNPPPDRRCGMQRRAGMAGIWQYVRTDCARQSMLSVVGHLRNTGAVSQDDVRSTLSRDFPDLPEIAAFESLLLEAAAD